MINSGRDKFITCHSIWSELNCVTEKHYSKAALCLAGHLWGRAWQRYWGRDRAGQCCTDFWVLSGRWCRPILTKYFFQTKEVIPWHNTTSSWLRASNRHQTNCNHNFSYPYKITLGLNWNGYMGRTFSKLAIFCQHVSLGRQNVVNLRKLFNIEELPDTLISFLDAKC